MQNLVRTSSIPAEAEPLKGIATGKSKWSKVMSWIREFLAVGFWIAIVGHLLFVDMFQLVREVHPTLSVLMQYRFFVLIGSISVAWLVLGNKAFSATIAYILFYPIIVLFLHVPIAFAKHWALLIVFSPAIYSLIKHFRVNFLLTSLAAISALFICVANLSSGPVITSGMTFLGLYLVLHYAVRLRRGYSQTSVFTELKPMILKVRKFVDTLEIGKPPSCVSDAPEYKEVREKFGQSLLTGYAITALLYFITERMRQVVNSRRLDIYFVGSLAYSAVLTTVVFGFEFFGLYRLDSNSFTGLKDPTVVDFIGYSFSTLMTASASPLTPASRWAFLLSQLEVLSALTLLVLLVFLVLTSIRERYKNDLDSMVLDLKQTSDHASQLITTNSDLTMEGIVAWLVEWNPQLAKLALFLMHGRIAGADLYEKVVASQAIRVPEESDIDVAIQAESTAQSTLSRDQLLEVKPSRRKPRKGD